MFFVEEIYWLKYIDGLNMTHFRAEERDPVRWRRSYGIEIVKKLLDRQALTADRQQSVFQDS